MLNALRLYQGVPQEAFAQRTGLPADRIAPALAQAQARGWLQDTPGRLQPSPLGQRFLNDLIELFLA
jgi:oxygen-independent coproporphyrinogen-3 oxidase